MNDTPKLTTPEQVLKRSGYQSLQPVRRPEYWGVDLDPARRPGVPMEREPQPFPNTRYPPERQRGVPASPMHGRSNKEMPAVFGTSTPLRGLSGAVRKFAYRYPDHYPSHWLLKMLGDRVDSWTYHAKKYLPFALPLAGIAYIVAARASESEPRRSTRRIPESVRGYAYSTH
ncbi:hypothetical protein [Pyxidicoccus xibeiensis]|uniref:hypothetical protein n=1 Tax=Pyxidicoccus xibeiensis TaxID=2906759 RepID=UPI0020A7C784|nr:hypothetical protein [Pyxidicoccus xibeiensis]MCP3140458.1 hypothetical protein [Pyxidicoccus xibeiensis]